MGGSFVSSPHTTTHWLLMMCNCLKKWEQISGLQWLSHMTTTVVHFHLIKENSRDHVAYVLRQFPSDACGPVWVGSRSGLDLILCVCLRDVSTMDPQDIHLPPSLPHFPGVVSTYPYQKVVLTWPPCCNSIGIQIMQPVHCPVRGGLSVVDGAIGKRRV